MWLADPSKHASAAAEGKHAAATTVAPRQQLTCPTCIYHHSSLCSRLLAAAPPELSYRICLTLTATSRCPKDHSLGRLSIPAHQSHGLDPPY